VGIRVNDLGDLRSARQWRDHPLVDMTAIDGVGPSDGQWDLSDVVKESWASSTQRRRIMQSNRRRDTKPELAVRRRLHAAGLRYRVDLAPIPGLRRRADIVFPRERIAIFIDGCFWHGCPEHGPIRFSTNANYWVPKIAENRARDLDTSTRFEAAGWTVLRFWSHADPSAVADEVRVIVDRQRAIGSTGEQDARA
jgi:DNA mismatch endonuclease (patch repair protein)